MELEDVLDPEQLALLTLVSLHTLEVPGKDVEGELAECKACECDTGG